MTEGNGHSPDGMANHRETVVFELGGEKLAVPVLTFADCEDLEEAVTALGPELNWLQYARYVIRIVAHQMHPTRPDLTEEVLKRSMLAGEGLLATQMNELLRRSGFPIPEAAPSPENPGIGTLTGSAPSSPSEVSAEATPSP